MGILEFPGRFGILILGPKGHQLLVALLAVIPIGEGAAHGIVERGDSRHFEGFRVCCRVGEFRGADLREYVVFVTVRGILKPFGLLPIVFGLFAGVKGDDVGMKSDEVVGVSVRTGRVKIGLGVVKKGVGNHHAARPVGTSIFVVVAPAARVDTFAKVIHVDDVSWVPMGVGVCDAGDDERHVERSGR